MLDLRLQQIYLSASKLFVHQSFSKTQVEHIVRETGISTGAVYDLFAGKKAIFQFVLQCTMNPDFIENSHQLPIAEIPFAQLEAQVHICLDEVVKRFGAPLRSGNADYPYAQMLSDAFDLLSQYSTGCLLFEANPTVYPELFCYYKEYRLKFYETVLEYVQQYVAAGVLRAQPHPGHTAKFIIETLYWWSMHIHYDGFNPHIAIPVKNAKEICLDALTHAYQAQ